MALNNRDAYKTLEEIVGPEYISEEPAVLDSYAFEWGAEISTGTPFLPTVLLIRIPNRIAAYRKIPIVLASASPRTPMRWVSR